MIFRYHTPRNVISFLSIIIFIAMQVSCGTASTSTTNTVSTLNPAVSQIINSEIQKFDDANEIYIEDTYYNHHLKGVLNAYGNKDRLVLDQLSNSLTDFEVTELLNNEQINHYIEQLEKPAQVPETAQPAGKKIIKKDLSSGTDNNNKAGQRLKEIDKNRMIISTPIFTKDKKFALVDVSKGRLNSMYTTINLYQRAEGGNYVFYKTLIGFME